MNNRVLKIVAGALALGAVGVAFLGIKLSQQPASPRLAPMAAAPALSASAVVAVHALHAGRPIAAADVSVRAIATLPEKAYAALPDVIGRVPSVDVASGDVLKAPHFASGSLASLLHAGERAVAVRVDEVIGLGGFAQPGDRVDVLLFLQPSKETGERSLSRVVIQDARLLTIGDESQLPEDSTSSGGPSGATPAFGGSDGKAKPANDKDRRTNQRSAVLALREADASRLMLASSAGQLRLSLRPQAADASASSPATGNVTLNELTGGAAPSPALPSLAGPRLASPRRSGIIIHEGDKVRTTLTPEDRP